MLKSLSLVGRPAKVHVFAPGQREQVQGRLHGTITGAGDDVIEIDLEGNWFRADWYGAELVVEVFTGEEVVRFNTEALPMPGGHRLRVKPAAISSGQRRRVPRADLTCPGRLRMASGIAWEVSLLNIGTGGALVTCLRRPEVGDRVELTFTLPGGRAYTGILSQVVRIGPARQGRVAVALHFRHMPPAVQVALSDLVGARL